MSYTAQPPAPTQTSREFTVVIRAQAINDPCEVLEKIIGDTIANRLGFETTVDYTPPF